ncbi:MAG: nucleoside hydrolase [Clostridia bacterium]|nr:nucleoside hydrolase [Clostridia bacterium]
MTEGKRIAMLEPPSGKVSIILDTDAACEVDDQYAIAYAVRAAEAGELILEGIHATLSCPDVAAGMERNYQEILKVLDLMHSPAYKEKTYRGPTRKFNKNKEPEMSDAVKHLIEVANDETREGPLYVVAIGAGTNIANALVAAPEIKEKIVLVWLAGNSLHHPHVYECNFLQDTCAGDYLFDCGVPMVLLPAFNVMTGLSTTVYELEYYLSGKNEICDYLLQLVKDYREKTKVEWEAWSKVIWDIGGVAYILHPEWFETRLVPTPIIGANWGSDPTRPTMRICDFVKRDFVFTDVFNKITK